jgi:hypothetical protein
MTHDRDLRIRAQAFAVFQDLVSFTDEKRRKGLEVFNNDLNTQWWTIHRTEYIN